MKNPTSDEVASQPRRDVAMGCNWLFLTIVLLLVAVLAGVGWLTWPADTPNPSGTASPEAVPGSG